MNNFMWIAMVIIGLIIVALLAFASRWFNASTLQTKIINPKPGIECVIVSATDSTSIDCWKTGGNDLGSFKPEGN